MAKVIIIVGFGPGTSAAVAERFGAEGFSLALVAGNRERLTARVGALNDRGITAAAFPADASNPTAIRHAIGGVRDRFGQIDVLHWNASGGHGLGDLLTLDPASVTGVFDVAGVGLLTAVQKTYPT